MRRRISLRSNADQPELKNISNRTITRQGEKVNLKEDEQLLRITQGPRKKAQRRKPSNIASAIKTYLTRQVLPLERTNIAIIEAWENILPKEIAAHSKLTGVSAGALKVTVDSPIYMHQLNLCKDELLYQLQQECPRVQIKKINFIIGHIKKR